MSRGVDRSRPEPLYRQLETLLRQQILAGRWAAGERIPTEEQLVEAYGVSRVTVRQALRNLVLDGYLERGPGRGTFVRKPTLTAGERGLTSFTQDMDALGLRAGARLVQGSVVPAPRQVASRLGVPVGQPVYLLKRLRTGDGQPIGVQTTYLVEERFPDLLAVLSEDASIYETLRERYGLTIDEAHETFAVTAIGKADAALLGVPANDCGFYVERVAFSGGAPFEFTASIMRGDRYRIRWVLKGPASAPSGAARSAGGRRGGRATTKETI